MRLFFSNAFMGGMVLAGSFLFPLQAVGQDRVTVDGKEVPSQLDDLDGDGGADHLFFLADIKAKQSKATIALWRKAMPNTYTKRTFADILLRNSKVKAKNKHDIYLSVFASLRGTNPFPVIHVPYWRASSLHTASIAVPDSRSTSMASAKGSWNFTTQSSIPTQLSWLLATATMFLQ